MRNLSLPELVLGLLALALSCSGGSIGDRQINDGSGTTGAGGRGGTAGTDSSGGKDSAGSGGADGSDGGAGGQHEGGGGEGATERLRIATFNIKDFGPTKLGRPEVMSELVSIVRGYPFVAVQEISDINEEVPYAFLEQLNLDGATYEMLLSPRSGQQPDDSTFEEQYAFYFDAAMLKPLSEGDLYDDSADDYFVREPYVARFEASTGSTFVAITIHTQPDNAVVELGQLDDVVAWAEGQFPDEDDFILLGDLNAGCAYASPTELDALAIRTNEYLWIVPDDADTNLAMSQCAYDRIVTTAATSSNYADNWGVDQAFTNTMVSDHWPVWAEFWADER